jgi:bis(5'-adenosyl)-triphosphatase
MNKNCPFCAEHIREATFAENEHFLAIYNIAPILPGHSMIIPKNHYCGINELSEELLKEMIVFSRDITQFLTKHYRATGFDWSIQEGEDAGQSVEHLHWHIIPRRKNDLKSPGAWYSKLQNSEKEPVIDSHARKKLTSEELQRITDELREAFKAE